MIHPTIHLNGTSLEALLDSWREAHIAITDAIEKLRQCAPNGRDYYPQSDGAFSIAVREHDARIKALRNVQTELEQLGETAQETPRGRKCNTCLNYKDSDGSYSARAFLCKHCKTEARDQLRRSVAGKPVLTFEEFKATRKASQLYDDLQDESFMENAIGFLYCDGLYIEDTSTWTQNREAGQWHTLIGRECYQSDDLETIEWILYSYAVSEGIADLK